MNKFSFGLHLAMFRQDLENRNFEQLDFLSETERVIEGTQVELEQNKEDAINDPDFSRVVEEVITKAKERGGKDFESKKTRFDERVNGNKYKRTENIKASRQSLKQQMSSYFIKYSKAEQLDKMKNVLTLYREEVVAQYLKYVWDAEDGDFDENKNILFTATFTGNPAKNVLEYIRHETSKTIEGKQQVYEVKPTLEQDNPSENIKISKKVKFLAHDLPNYLWELKDLNFLQDFWYNGLVQKHPFLEFFFDTKLNIPSSEDKDQIKKFIYIVDNLEGENPELKLIEVFEELEKNSSKEKIKEALNTKGITLKKDKYLSNIKEAFDFYKSTQVSEIPVEKQHLMYLSILQIIKNEGGFDKAINAFKKDVEKAKKSSEGKEYKNGKKLEENNSELKSLAEKLGISDFTSATRLNEKGDGYFKDTKIVDILADINNDGVMTYADKGLTKTGLQFKRIYETIDVGEEKALENLLSEAKLLNKILKLGIDETQITANEIKKGNKKLILLLQSIIANPGEDLIPLMRYGTDGEKKYDEKELQKILESSEEYARKLLKDIEPALSGIDGVVSPEGLHQAVAGALYTEYTKGVGIGGRISFDEWVKGLSLNGGIQVTEKGVNIGLNLAYNREFDIGKGWTITPGASAGLISILENPIPISALSVGAEVARKWLDDNGVEKKLGGKISFTEVGPLQVYSALVGGEMDKGQIEKQRGKIETEVNKNIITPFLEELNNELGGESFDLEQQSIIDKVETVINNFVENLPDADKEKLDADGMEKIKTNLIRLLANHNKKIFSDSAVRKHIATEMSKQYSNAWYEQRIKDLDGKTYVSYAKLGISLIAEVVVPVGIVGHVGIGITTHEEDIYGNKERNNYISKAETGKEWTQDMIDKFNEKLPDNAKFQMEDGHVLIPYAAFDQCDIRINPGMQGLIKKSDKGILLSPKTFITFPSVRYGSASISYLIMIGGGDSSSAVDLKSKIQDQSWFTEDDIDEKKLTGREIEFTMIELNNTLKEIQKEIKERDGNEYDVIHNWTFNPNILEKLQKGKSNKIVLTNNNGNIERDVKINEDSDNETLQIEYKRKKEIEHLMDTRAQEIAKIIYGEANKVTTNTLYSISHDIMSNGTIIHHKWPEYVNFANAVKEKNYKKAKRIIIELLPKMDKFINKKQRRQEHVNFSNIISTLNEIVDNDIALGQVMLSINNIFARVPSVRGGKENEYYFQKYVGGNMADVKASDIIGPRGEEIKRRINNTDLNNDLNTEEKNSYLSLVDAMSSYVKAHPEKYGKTSLETETLNNAVGFNLGNAISLETPLFNPEIYKGSMINLEELSDFEGKDTLQERLMKKMLEDKSLIGPVLKELKIDVDSEIDIEHASYEGGKITIDIGGKKVTFSASMCFGYFSQCVNHMAILNNIQAYVEGGASVNFEPQVSGTGDVFESVLVTSKSDRSGKVDISFTIHQETPTEPETPTETPTPTTTPDPGTPTPTPTTTPDPGTGGGGSGDMDDPAGDFK